MSFLHLYKNDNNITMCFNVWDSSDVAIFIRAVLSSYKIGVNWILISLLHISFKLLTSFTCRQGLIFRHFCVSHTVIKMIIAAYGYFSFWLIR